MKILSLIAMIVVAGRMAVSAEPPPKGEPTHQGKPVAYWVAALEPGTSISTQAKQVEAEEAIHAIGPEAIPFILRFQNRNREQRLSLIRHACAVVGPEGDLRLVEALHDADGTVRETALEVIPKSTLPAALDDIVHLLSEPAGSIRTAALQALVRLAPDREETIAALVEALHDPRPAIPGSPEFTRGDAALALGALGPKAKSAIPALTELLTASDDEVREAAATALWKIERNAQVVSVLVERLENARDYQTSIRVLKVLAEMGPHAKAAVPVIRQKIDDPGVSFVPATVNFAQVAMQALAQIEPAVAAAVRKEHPEILPNN